MKARAVLIVTLTTIPPRFDKIGPTLATLLGQSAQIDEIRLVIPKTYRRFPEWSGALPDLPDGISVQRPETDLGPATKVLYTARDFRGRDDVQILFCDDDRAYGRDWAAHLSGEHKARPDDVVALSGWDITRIGMAAPRAHPAPRHVFAKELFNWDYKKARLKQILRHGMNVPKDQKPQRELVGRAGYADILEGFGGVVIRPDVFDDAAFDIPAKVWTVDDVWLSGMLAKRGIKIWLPSGALEPKLTAANEEGALSSAVIEGVDRAAADKLCVALLQEKLGIWQA